MTERIAHDALRALVTRIYEHGGMPARDAALIADTLVQADLWGHQSHGVLRTRWYYARLRSGAMKPVTEPRIVKDRGAVAVIDAQDGVGQVVTEWAAREAIARAKAHGLAAIAVRNSNHFGTCMG